MPSAVCNAFHSGIVFLPCVSLSLSFLYIELSGLHIAVPPMLIQRYGLADLCRDAKRGDVLVNKSDGRESVHDRHDDVESEVIVIRQRERQCFPGAQNRHLSGKMLVNGVFLRLRDAFRVLRSYRTDTRRIVPVDVERGNDCGSL